VTIRNRLPGDCTTLEIRLKHQSDKITTKGWDQKGQSDQAEKRFNLVIGA